MGQFRELEMADNHVQIGCCSQSVGIPISASAFGTLGGFLSKACKRTRQAAGKGLTAGQCLSMENSRSSVENRRPLPNTFGGCQSFPYGSIGLMDHTRSHSRE